MKQAFQLLIHLFRWFAGLLSRLHVGLGGRMSDDQLDYRTINISTR